MELSDLTGSTDPDVKALGDRVAGYKAQLDAGQISLADYADLCGDVAAMAQVESGGQTADLLSDLSQAISFVESIARSAL
jgi:hypothetical protein